MDVYGTGLDFAVDVHHLTDRYKAGRKHIADQLRRASCSVITNTSEAAGEKAPLEKARIFRLALRSATECTGLLTLSYRLDLLTTDELQRTRNLNIRVYAMLTRLVRTHEAAGLTG